MSAQDDAEAVGLKIVRGSADDAEVAALVAGFVAFTAATEEEPAPGSPTSAWMDRARTMRGSLRQLPLAHSAASWRHSLR